MTSFGGNTICPIPSGTLLPYINLYCFSHNAFIPPPPFSLILSSPLLFYVFALYLLLYPSFPIYQWIHVAKWQWWGTPRAKNYMPILASHVGHGFHIWNCPPYITLHNMGRCYVGPRIWGCLMFNIYLISPLKCLYHGGHWRVMCLL